MKAARWYQPWEDLRVEDVPDPELRPSGAIVMVLSTRLPAFTGDVLSGRLGCAFPEPSPFTPGTDAMDVVENVLGLQTGQLVFCDPHVSSKTIGGEPVGILISWTGSAPAAPRSTLAVCSRRSPCPMVS